ncbi:MAG: stage II sporulation protein P [Clostridia bacterium]|nr:stage II sporulation protein P [Clostridia bacterium]
MKHALFCMLFCFMTLCLCAADTLAEDWADDSVVTAVSDLQGNIVFSLCGNVSEGDEYISQDNTLYRIKRAEHGSLIAESIGTETMPDVSWLASGEAQAVFSDQSAIAAAAKNENPEKRLIAMYVTHSDESYVPTDGTQSIEGQGGIYDVAREFRDALQGLGIDVILDESTHLPHDSGAYRRSRQTAERLLKKRPDAIIDIHRDGIPDAEEYKVTLGGEDASQIRLLVGRANQNSAVNREFAKELKAIADQQYPGLIKDIFIGKGTYNQDLSPNAILLEFGTHTISKERVLNSVDKMANVVSTSLYGTQTGSAKSEDTVKSTQKKENRGAASGILWMIVLGVIGAGIFAFAQTGSTKGMKEKLGRGISEMTGGMLGKKKKDK